uniref:FAD-binding FR-type domain-containing protein n=1 Tax=Amphora coffeiformis TaxID=265554 RepID=A0A7S3KXV2_9STRA
MTTTQSSSSKADAFLQPLYHVRYLLARPLQLRLLPSVIPVIPLPYLKSLPYVTVGQVLMMVPWLLLFVAGYDKTFHNADLGGGGKIASYAMICAFLTANKANSVFQFFFGLSFERMVPIHNLYACLSLILSVFHGYVAYKYGDARRRLGGSEESTMMDHEERRLGHDSEYGLYGDDTNLWKFLWDGGTNLTGSLCTACLVGLVLFSFFRVIRQYLFEVWLFSHIIFSVGVVVFGVMHSVPILLVPFAWWMVDVALRYGLQAFGRFPTSAKLTKLGDDLVEVRFQRSFHFQPGQFVQISIPAVGLMQFHPVTISSAPYEKDATLHIRALGGWTKALVELAGRTQETNILVEGPYGNLSFGIADETTYPVVLCIAGGIGVTVSSCWGLG